MITWIFKTVCFFYNHKNVSPFSILRIHLLLFISQTAFYFTCTFYYYTHTLTLCWIYTHGTKLYICGRVNHNLQFRFYNLFFFRIYRTWTGIVFIILFKFWFIYMIKVFLIRNSIWEDSFSWFLIKSNQI